MDDSSATQVIPGGEPPRDAGDRRKKRWWLWLAISIGVLILVIIAIAAVALGGGTSGIITNATPSAMPSSAPPTEVPSPSASAPTAEPNPVPVPPPPHDEGPKITLFTVSPTQVNCSSGGPFFPGVTSAALTITWTSTGGAEAYIGVDTIDAQLGSFAGPLPPDNGMYTDLNYNCPETHRYTLTVVSATGEKASATQEVVNTGEKPLTQ